MMFKVKTKMQTHFYTLRLSYNDRYERKAYFKFSYKTANSNDFYVSTTQRNSKQIISKRLANAHNNSPHSNQTA